MPKVEKFMLGTLIAIQDHDGNDYEDWHKEHVNTQGIIILETSLHKFPGKHFVVFYHSPKYCDRQFLTKHITTSMGEIVEDNDKTFSIKTNHSLYTFSYEHDLPETAANDLMFYGAALKRKADELELRKKRLAFKKAISSQNVHSTDMIQ